MPKLRIKWDMEKALSMWLAGDKVYKIARECRVSENTINSAVDRYEWPKRARPVSDRRHAGMVWKRCPGCLAMYRAKPLDHATHCNRVPAPLSGVAA